ncbi:MAG: hypothetical protein A3J47_02655 [Candidatus Yanofskybacteria bacterium RIFCSPHIGHO2_02_FULL_43_22]|uniref:Reverse transcriptase domain-containing protein n=1 Tax=Candidatus Yanofskybacteria bacterium RIFCSPHIGHO2_02_FULL_43_22 TaxID=1802681 RepID=A0A1F8FNU5_9BACT|nr:MAG: hypothetical protein A3J47_02655 [Candidatus Yanofskybacteria bacterium RIFCSPHIGHO2_02_FULL_43_22]
MRIKLTHAYKDIISLENLLLAWKEFITGKKKRKDVQEFERYLMGNIISLHDDLDNKIYAHSSYETFNISDPKPRHINKAKVRDRLLHHAIYRILYPFFDRTFISDSFSCRINKGTHRALNRFRQFEYKASRNHTKTCWILKCDIRKFFENIDHEILVEILKKYIPDKNILWLLERVIYSFSTAPGRGLPLGNLTSQLFVNIYMNEFDQFVKHGLKVKHYIRYADDFVVFSHDKTWLEELLPRIADFLKERLKLQIHPDKIYLKTLASGVDFLGWVHFPDHRTLRTTTKRRMFKKIKENSKPETVNSYLGLLKHGNTFNLKHQVELLTEI